MSKITTSGQVQFHCICQLLIEGTPEDTLMASEFYEASESDLKYSVFVENSPFDPAGRKEKKQCPKCRLPFMTMVRLGSNEKVLYTCQCGYSGV